MSNVTTAIVRRVGILIFAFMCYGALPASTVSAQQPSEQLPAARLLVGAYSFVIIGLFLYVVSVARRLTTVQREVERLEADVKRTGRA
jgi:CcmD family protein